MFHDLPQTVTDGSRLSLSRLQNTDVEAFPFVHSEYFTIGRHCVFVPTMSLCIDTITPLSVLGELGQSQQDLNM